MVRPNATPNPSHHFHDVGRVRTIALILSVTVANVCPGPMMPGWAGPVSCSAMNSASLAMPVRLPLIVRVRVADGRQVGQPRAGVQVAEQAVMPRVAFEPGHLATVAVIAPQIVHVAEDDRPRRTRGLAGGE